MVIPKPNCNSIAKTAILLAVQAIFSVGKGQAQEYTSLRNPLIYGASQTGPNQAASPGQPPPVGSGGLWYGTPPGDPGAPMPPPTVLFIPPVDAYDKPLVDSFVDPYLAPAANNYPYLYDPGMLSGTTSGYIPPAQEVGIAPQGGMPGDFAPRQRWPAQTTRDLGVPAYQGSTLHDFGVNLQVSAQQSGTVPTVSQDGPRPFVFPAPITATTNRNPNLPGAQVTQDLYGDRELFMGPNVRARMTKANF